MSKEKVKYFKSAQADSVAEVPATPAENPTEQMAESDVVVLQLAKARQETIVAQAKEALAKAETAEVSYKYVVLQLYMKYGLTAADAITENGGIVRGGAVAPAPQGK